MTRLIFNLGFALIGLLSLFALVRVSSDYLSTINSIQNFRWRVAAFEPPTADSTESRLTLEVQNRSNIDLDFKDLEVYLWLNDKTVGKTYGRFEARTIAAHANSHIPLTIQIDTNELRDTLAKNSGSTAWSLTGSYKVGAPFAASDFLYRLRLDIAP